MVQRTVAKPSPPLVQDVINLILEQIYYLENSSKPDLRGLAGYSRISKAWRLPAQILLFRQVRIRTQRDLMSVEYAFAGLGAGGMRYAKMLKHSVRVLRIRVHGTSSGEGSTLCNLGVIHPEQLPHCLRLFPYLYELRINVQRVTKFDDAVLQALNDTPPIQSLMIYKPSSLNGHIPYYSFSCGAAAFITLHFQLLQIRAWPLKYFALCGALTSGSFSGFTRPVHKFKGVRLEVPGWTYNEESRSLRWLLWNSLDTIEHLSVPRYMPFIQKVAPRLKSFECGDADPGVHPFVPLPKAEEVLWFQMPRITHLTPGAAYSTMVPKRVTHLGISMHCLRLSGEWWKDLAPVVPKTLKRITIISFPKQGYSLYGDSETISKAFGGIEVRLFDDILEYRNSTPVCMLPDKPFPYVPSMKDFDIMTRLVSEVHETTKSGKPSTPAAPSTSTFVVASRKSSSFRQSSNHPIKRPNWR